VIIWHALAGKAKAGMVRSVSGWMWGVQVKLWSPLSALEVCLQQGAIQIHVYLTLPYLILLIGRWWC